MLLNYKCDPKSFVGNGEITNENGEVVYQIKRKLISITKKVKVFDTNNQLEYVIKNKIFRLFLKSAYVYSKGKKIAKVTRKIAIKSNYSIEGFSQKVRIDGSIVGGNYRIISDEKCIAEITNAAAFQGKNLEIYDEEDMGIVVAIYLAIVNIVYQK